MEIVKHCDDVVQALKDIKGLLSVDGRVNMTNYIRAEYLINELLKILKED